MTAVLPEYSPAAVDDVVLTIDGADLLTDGWAARLVPTTSGCKPGCTFAEFDLGDACACQPPLYEDPQMGAK